ncbi:MAG: FtsX-like permease family protein [Gemmatimonadetes bacterium]|nr:FtsX-like permease family protein [Gemmatimonadota bacterium]
MLIGETIRVALGALRANKLRSLLTMLGIVIGVAAVIAVVALGNGAQKQINDRITALGTTLLTVNPGQAMGGGIRTGGGGARLTTDDAQALADRGTHMLAVQPEMEGRLQVVYGTKNTNVSIIGSTSNYPEVRNYVVEFGRFFTHAEDQTRRRVAVIGPAVATNLGLETAEALIGETIRIRGIQFEVVGAFKTKGSGGGFGNPDEQILIPIETARFRVLGNNRVRSIGVLAPSEAEIPETMANIQTILRREHRLRPGREDDFQIRSQSDFLNTLSETTQTMGLLLAGIAAVSLVVGGIGIMNIMLVSVTERTREIGVRKALGATRLNIMFQFLIEAIVLCMVGGALGIAAGVGGGLLVTSKFGWPTAIGADSVAIAFGFSAFVGIVFGVYPARRAATMDPIVALRFE